MVDRLSPDRKPPDVLGKKRHAKFSAPYSTLRRVMRPTTDAACSITPYDLAVAGGRGARVAVCTSLQVPPIIPPGSVSAEKRVSTSADNLTSPHRRLPNGTECSADGPKAAVLRAVGCCRPADSLTRKQGHARGALFGLIRLLSSCSITGVRRTITGPVRKYVWFKTPTSQLKKRGARGGI